MNPGDLVEFNHPDGGFGRLEVQNPRPLIENKSQGRVSSVSGDGIATATAEVMWFDDNINDNFPTTNWPQDWLRIVDVATETYLRLRATDP